MTDPDPPAVDRPPASSSWLWLLPALTFLAGCLLAGLVVGVGQLGSDDGDASAPGPQAQEEGDEGVGDSEGPEGADGDVFVRVPESCLQASESALALADQADRIAVAVRDLDARALRDLVDEVQQVRDDVQSSGEQCRRSAGEGVLEGSATSPAPSEPAASEPAPAESARSEPTPSEPTPSEPAA